MGKFAECGTNVVPSYSSAYLEQLGEDIQRCAASLGAKAQPMSVVEGLDQARLSGLGEELTAALRVARDNAHRLVDQHRQCFPESPLFSTCTLLRPLGYSRREVAVTQVLGWLFDPQADHGFGGLIVRAFLETLRDTSEAAEKLLAFGDGDISVYAEFALNEANRADIVIASQGHAVVIEAKIDAREGLAQTQRYSRDFGKRFPVCTFVFLTPQGALPTHDRFLPLRYLDIARILVRVLEAARNVEGFHYARYFTAGMLNDLCDIRTSNNIDEVLRSNSFELETLLGSQA